MPIAFYMDHNVARAITTELRSRGIDVLTAYEDNASELDDAALLDRASELERVLFTQDRDFLVEARRRQTESIPFHGIVYAHQLWVSIGKCVQDLELIARAGNLEELTNYIQYLPL